MSITTTTRRSTRRVRLGGTIAAVGAAAAVLASASPAAAHHGWDGFDTDHLVYIAGTVSSDGSWGDPHSYFDISLQEDLPSDTPDELAIPEDLQAPEDSIRVLAALAYDGDHDELEVVIAPPAWSGPWGLPRPLEIGERFQGVGYVNRADDGLFRPVVFWWGDEQVPVNQVLGSTLPAHPPLPQSAETASPNPSASGASETPRSSVEPSTDETMAAEESDQSDSRTWVVWTAFGVIVVIAAAGGALYLRHRTRRSGAS